MERIKGLIREPALLIDLAETLVLMFVAFGVGLTGDQQLYIVAAVVAGLGFLKAAMTRPFVVAALTDFGRALLVLFASFGVGLSADRITLLITALGTLTTIIMRSQITPASDPITDLWGSGAGPVRGRDGTELGEKGESGLLYVLLVVVVVFIFLILVLPRL